MEHGPSDSPCKEHTPQPNEVHQDQATQLCLNIWGLPGSQTPECFRNVS